MNGDGTFYSIGVRIYKLCVTLTKDVISSYLFDSNLSLAGNSVSSLQSFSVGSESLRKKVMGAEEEEKVRIIVDVCIGQRRTWPLLQISAPFLT